MQRNLTIDYLRFFGITLIILAHVEPPEMLFNFRCFDVCLMLFVSGLAYSGRKADFSAGFFLHRITRLIIPVYLFLTCYFLCVAIMKGIGVDFGIRREHIIGSFLLTEGIGFVWIIRVFLLIAILTPFLQKMEQCINNTYVLVIVLFAFMFIIELLIMNNIGLNSDLVHNYVYYATGYSVPFVLGLRMGRNTTKTASKVLAGLLCLFVLCAISSNTEGRWWLVNNYKYPPRLYYVTYGSLMSVLLLLLLSSKRQLVGYSLPMFIARNTIWIYLWHIPFIQLTGRVFQEWYIRYPIVYICATVICYFQVKIVESLIKKHGEKPFYKYLKG